MAFLPEMSEELQAKVLNLNPFQRSYCEYRAKGFSQSASADKAGSKAKDKAGLGRIGFQVETIDGVKEYIMHLKALRVQTSTIDSTKVIEMIKEVYDKALDKEKFKEANESAKLLGLALGLFDHKANGIKTIESINKEEATKNNVEAFREDDVDDNKTSERIEILQKMMIDLNKEVNSSK